MLEVLVISDGMLYNRARQFNNGRRSYFVVTLSPGTVEGEWAMKKRILAVFLAAAALACSLSACGGATTQTTAPSDETTPSSGAPHANELNVGIAQDLDDSLDPYQMTAAGTREVMFTVFEGRVKPDSSGNYVNAVASEFGGGGHILASGCMLFGEYEEVIERLTYAVYKQL